MEFTREFGSFMLFKSCESGLSGGRGPSGADSLAFNFLKTLRFQPLKEICNKLLATIASCVPTALLWE